MVKPEYSTSKIYMQHSLYICRLISTVSQTQRLVSPCAHVFSRFLILFFFFILFFNTKLMCRHIFFLPFCQLEKINLLRQKNDNFLSTFFIYPKTRIKNIIFLFKILFFCLKLEKQFFLPLKILKTFLFC